ncbi:MAG: ABC transporter permease [Planctomycetes bacterium]|nr:ABC transporter permease [Planctomycetota bacterium]
MTSITECALSPDPLRTVGPERAQESIAEDPPALSTNWLAELWRYRELVYFLAWRDVKVRYKQAVLGAAWAILQPLLGMVVFTFFFGGLAGIATDDVPYPVFSFCALVLWTYFSTVISHGGQSLVGNSGLITKVYFPRMALPLSATLSGLIDLAIGLAFMVFVLAYFGVYPNWTVLLAPFFLGTLIILTAGASLILSALNVSYRDIKYAIPFLIQLGLFVTPVIYPITIIPDRFWFLVALNPLSGIVEGFRACLIPGQAIDPMLTVMSLTMTAIVFATGVILFRRTERVFADVI